VPTRFLLCSNDRFFPAEFMRRVVRERLRLAPDEMDSGHLPALSNPGELADRLEGYRLASSSANLELVRSIYAGWEQGYFSAVDWADPEIDFGFVDGPEPGRWTGLRQMSARFGDWLRAWKDFRAEPEQYLVVDDTRILVLVHNSGRGRTSGLELEQRSVANFFEVQGGVVTRLVIYWDRDRARADLGLGPEPG
jgi:ketosteroid isomerase-like protein